MFPMLFVSPVNYSPVKTFLGRFYNIRNVVDTQTAIQHNAGCWLKTVRAHTAYYCQSVTEMLPLLVATVDPHHQYSAPDEDK